MKSKQPYYLFFVNEKLVNVTSKGGIFFVILQQKVTCTTSKIVFLLDVLDIDSSISTADYRVAYIL